MKAKVALTVGGLDPSGGAGITGDVVTFAALGVHGAAVATALTFQNTRGVTGYWTVAPREFEIQMDTLLADVSVAAVKLGMLAADGVVEVLVPYLQRFKEDDIPVVFDPVFRAGGGEPLYEGSPSPAVVSSVIENVSLVTPNALELAFFLEEEAAKSLGELRTQVRVFQNKFGTPVLATGGHLTPAGDVFDVFFSGEEMRELRRPRVAGKIHGTGCLVAAAVTAHLAAGADLPAAVERAHDYVSSAMAGSFPVGEGALVPDRTAATFDDAERWRVYRNVQRAVSVFEAGATSYRLIPEVGTNIGFALPDATSPGDVCAVSGRIVCVGKAPRAVGTPAFGASGHVARAILAAMACDQSVRAAMNVRWGEDVIAACRELKLNAVAFDRTAEPPAEADAEGRTMSWGVARAIAEAGAVPAVVYDLGAPGKEPMVRIFGRDAVEVVRRAMAIARRLP